MTDQLTRAWRLLREGERPDGLSTETGNGMRIWWLRTKGGNQWLPAPAAYAMLCQAVEGVLHRLGMAYIGGDWIRIAGYVEIDGSCIGSDRGDRLTAACDALESVRGEAADA